MRFALAIVLLAGCATSSATGTWRGLIGPNGKKPAPVQFVLEEKNGKLTGTTAFLDSQNPHAVSDGLVTGARDGSTAAWVSETDVRVQGTFDGDSFVGTITFPSIDEIPAQSGPIVLNRTAGQ